MKSFERLLFGQAGVPHACQTRSSADGVAATRAMGLDVMELQFVRGVKMGMDTANEVRQQGEKHQVVLTAHGPYYINLNSDKQQTIKDSITRILDTARVLHGCGGWSMVFHPGYYMKSVRESVYAIVKKSLQEIMDAVKDRGHDVWVRPETTGKESQFGSLQELLRLSQEFDKVMPCIDFSHLHARSNGKFNTYPEFREVLTAVENALGKRGLQNMHCHISGINYGPAGEKNHLNLAESDLNIKDLLKGLKEFKARGVVVCESPNQEDDALYMQDLYERL